MSKYDVMIIGTGAGGGTMAYALAPTGKKILLLERGDYLPRERENWETHAVYKEKRYNAKETMYHNGQPLHTCYALPHFTNRRVHLRTECQPTPHPMPLPRDFPGGGLKCRHTLFLKKIYFVS